MNAERETQRHNEYLRHTIDSSAQRVAREMQEAYSRMNPHWEALITSPLFEAMQRIQESSAALRAIVDSPALRAAGELGRYSAIWSTLIDLPAQGLISEANQHYQQLINTMSIPALQAISNHTLRYFESASASSRFPQSFVGQILDRLQGIADIEEDEEDVEREADIIEELFSERLGTTQTRFH
jgi:hypothetical protein